MRVTNNEFEEKLKTEIDLFYKIDHNIVEIEEFYERIHTILNNFLTDKENSISHDLTKTIKFVNDFEINSTVGSYLEEKDRQYRAKLNKGVA